MVTPLFSHILLEKIPKRCVIWSKTLFLKDIFLKTNNLIVFDIFQYDNP
ncbi:hypothetical protein D2M30_2642 [Bacillus amyloliquefaciens]|nr:hypothetical protein D2M30_2642 [Bacillus amyloliquefaciens]